MTADGTIRHKAGELVATLTSKEGVITTGLLYLGTYTITEVKAPEGYLLDDTPHDVTLAYGGQDVELVTESLTIENAPPTSKPRTARCGTSRVSLWIPSSRRTA